jgi:aldose 1-epimerase
MDTAPSGPLPPSGRQHVIGHGTSELVVTEVGATLRSYTVDGTPLVDGFGESELCSDGRGQVLAPWPNRLGDGRYHFGDRQGRAAWDEPQRRNAIHGLVRWMAWELRGHAQNSVTLGCLLEPQPAYPWRISLEVEYHLGRGGLTVRTTACNVDEAPAPFGIGFHPYLMVGTPAIDEARLRLVADWFLRSDDRGLPVGQERVAGSELDFRVARPIGPTRLDTAFAQLARDDGGIARVELRHPEGQRGLELWMDRSFGYVMVYSGDTVALPRRRGALAVEPMTCPPDALRSGTDLVTLAPGATWSGTWGITPTAETKVTPTAATSSATMAAHAHRPPGGPAAGG